MGSSYSKEEIRIILSEITKYRLEREKILFDDSDEELYVERVIKHGFIGSIIFNLSGYYKNRKYRKGFRLAKKILLLMRHLYKFLFNKNLNLNWLYLNY